MGNNKKSLTVVALALVCAVGLGVAIGANIKTGKGNIDHNNNGVPVADANLDKLSVEELGAKLGTFILPDDEFGKLNTAIYQTAMGLLMQQAQQAGVQVTDETQQNLKKSVDEKYSRKFFADINAGSMQEITKPDFVAIISFFNSESGQKYLKVSPKLIQNTMTAVQTDLSQWLPKTVEEIVNNIKNGNAPAKTGEAAPADGEAQEKAKANS